MPWHNADGDGHLTRATSQTGETVYQELQKSGNGSDRFFQYCPRDRFCGRFFSTTERKVKTVFVMLQGRKDYTKTSKGRQSLVLLPGQLLAVLGAQHSSKSSICSQSPTEERISFQCPDE